MFWTETSTTASTILKSLNLRVASTISSTISITANITTALTQDPVTGDLLVCDSQSGDILRCNPILGNCSVELDHSNLLDASASRTDVGKSE